jgi:hypothetical protein
MNRTVKVKGDDDSVGSGDDEDSQVEFNEDSSVVDYTHSSQMNASINYNSSYLNSQTITS